MGAALLGMLVLAGVLPVCWWLVAILSRGSPSSAILLPSPVQAFRAAFDSCYRTSNGAHEFWLSLQILASLGLGSLAVAAVLLPHAWQERNRPASDRNRAEDKGTSENLESVLHRRDRAQLLEGDPFCWLASRNRSAARPATLVLTLLFIVWICFLLAAVSSAAYRNAFIVCLFLGYGLHQVFKYYAAAEATRQVNEDRRSGALELLLVTPLTEDKIIAGHARAFRARFRPLAVLVGSANLLLMGAVTLSSGPLHMSGTDTGIFLELFVGGLLMLFLDFRTIETVGFWSALRAKRHGRAILATLGRVMGVPWGTVFLLVFMMMGGPGSAETAAGIFAVWFLIGIVTDLVVLGRASEAAQQGVRVCLTEATGVSRPDSRLPPPSAQAARLQATP